MLEYLETALDGLKTGVDQQIEPYLRSKEIPSTMAKDFAALNDACLQGKTQLSQYRIAIQRLLWSLDVQTEDSMDMDAKEKLSRQSVLYNWRLLDQLSRQPVYKLIGALTPLERWPVIDSVPRVNHYDGETVVPEPLLKLLGSADRKLRSDRTTMVKLNESQLFRLTTDFLSMLVLKYGDKDKVQTETLAEQNDRFECGFWLLDQLVQIAKARPDAIEHKSLFISLSQMRNALENYQDSLQTRDHSQAANELKKALEQKSKHLQQCFSVGQQGQSSSS
ncbi:MAG: hypothetical protein ACR2PT_09915 [Endozoicomonas sp.]